MIKDDVLPTRVVLQQPCLTKYRIPIFRELARRPGIDLTVVYGDEAGITNAQPEGFKAEFVKLHDKSIGNLLIRYHAAQYAYCTRERADVVILSWSTRYLSLLPGLVRARWNGVGVVLWGHGYSKSETSLRRATRRRFAGLADSLLFYNNTAAQQFLDEGGAPLDRVFVALNTIDLTPVFDQADRWRADTAALAKFRARLNLGAGPVVLFVSRLYRSNRCDLLLEAVRRLGASVPGLKVLVVGDGPDGPRLRELAQSLGVMDRVVFAGAVFSEDQLAPYFVSADVFCYPANIGLSLIHALGYGLPIVTSSKVEAQNPEIEAFRPGVNGLHYDDGDADSLAQTLQSVLTDGAHRSRLAQGAADTVRGDFLVEKMVDGMEAAIRTAAIRQPRPVLEGLAAKPT